MGKRQFGGHHPSELHGLITGIICAGSQLDSSDRRATLSRWLDIHLPPDSADLLDQVFNEVNHGLVDEEFGFRLLVPDDEEDVNDRTVAVSYWCSGFLAGFGMTGRYQESELTEDLKEVFGDLSRISSFSEDVPEDDENEADLVEIGEYVRMSALLVYTECAGKALH